MPKYKEKFKSQHSIDELYQLITDIEEYPQFLPWCSAARIIEEDDHLIIADLIITFQAFTEHYRSQVDLHPPQDDKASVNVMMLSGPFKHLHNNWRLSRKKGETIIEFDIDFEFKSALLENLMGLMFEKACKKMVKSFEERADELFGSKDGSRDN